MPPIKEYVLSSRFRFIPQKRWEESFKVKKIKEKVGLYDLFKDKVFIFDKIIADFIKQFKKSISYEDAKQIFLKKYALDPIVGGQKFTSFFNELLDSKFIVEANQTKVNKTNLPKFYKVGEFIDSYKITKHFNSHDTFQVYEALDAQKQRVIVKLYQLKDGYSPDEKAYAHAVLYRELIILKQLCKHPSISKLIEYDEKKNYGIIEYIQAISLRKFANRKTNQYTILEMMQIWYQILESIDYLHKNEYIHGDLHYSNILIEDGLKVRLIDFGLALHTSEIDSPDIRKGGIHAFLPPERLNDSYFNIVQSNATIGSDIYQVGILGYILLYRKVPFKAKTWKAITSNIKSHTIPFGNFAPNGEPISPELIALIQKCIHPETSKRAKKLSVILKALGTLIKKQKKNS